MARKLDILDQLHLNTPCTAGWDTMHGNDEVRFCGHCAKNIHNLSAMTRADALRLVEESRGGLCIRIEKTSAGSVFTRDDYVFSFPKLRLSPLAAAAFGIAITITPAFAQETPAPNCPKPEIVTTRKPAAEGSSSIIKGRLTCQPAMPMGGKVKVKLVQGVVTRETYTNANGEFIFEHLPAGIYNLSTEPNESFKPFVLNDIEVHSAETVEIVAKAIRTQDLMEFEGGAVAADFPVEINTDASVTDSNPRRNGNGAAMYFNAAAEGDLASLRKMFKTLKSVDVFSPEKETPLIYAIRGRKIESVKFLLGNGADPNARSVTGRTALMLAAMNGDTEIIRSLLKHGADRKLTDNEGQTAENYATKKEIADLLITSETK